MRLIIYKSRHERLTKTTKDEGSRKCRNWQTSKTKDLVTSLSCGFKSHLPHWMIRKSLRHKAWGFFRITHWGEFLSPSGFPLRGLGTCKARSVASPYLPGDLAKCSAQSPIFRTKLKDQLERVGPFLFIVIYEFLYEIWIIIYLTME